MTPTRPPLKHFLSAKGVKSKGVYRRLLVTVQGKNGSVPVDNPVDDHGREGESWFYPCFKAVLCTYEYRKGALMETSWRRFDYHHHHA